MGADAELIGRVIAERFRVTALVGEGAMAAVYRGVRLGAAEGTGDEVAIKVMHRHLAADGTFARRFRREAKAASRLRHPNTVHIVDYGVDHGLAFIAMELLSGRDLYELICQDGPLPGARAAVIMMQVCDALVTAHGRGILHRDLKPENVMLLHGEGGDRVKVLDFGIAKLVAPEHRLEDAPTSITGSGLTSVGAVLGTPEYMSPEQCQGGRLDFRSDIYACGVLLYQLVTGQVPFSGETPVHTMLKHVREPPKPPSTMAPRLEAAMEAVILRALEKRPEDRPASAAELGAALAAAIGKSGAWQPFETLAPGEYAFAGTPTPNGVPHLGPHGVSLPRDATSGSAPPVPFVETVRMEPPSEQRAPAAQPAPPRPYLAKQTLPLHAGAPLSPFSAAAHPQQPQPHAAAHLGGPTPPGAYPIAHGGAQGYGYPGAELTPSRSTAPASADGSPPPRSPRPHDRAMAEERSLAFYAITFAVVFMVVLVALTMIVFR
jgi:serine/threonine-protein kinase